VRRLIDLVSNVLISGILILSSSVLQADNITQDGANPISYNRVPGTSRILRLKDETLADAMPFTQYDSAFKELVHPVRGVSASVIEAPTTATSHGESTPSAAATPAPPTIDDPVHLLTDPEKTQLLVSLNLLPPQQWQGVQSIRIEPLPGFAGFNDQYDATETGLVVRIPYPAAHNLAIDASTLALAVGYYYFQYNLDSRTKTEFIGSGFAPASFYAHAFAGGVGFYIQRSGLTGIYLDSGPQGDSDSSGLLANDLFLAALFPVPDQPAVYAYTTSSGSLERTIQTAYIFGNTIVYDGMTIYFDNQHRITGVQKPGSRIISPLNPIEGDSTISPLVFRTFKHVTFARRPPVRPR